MGQSLIGCPLSGSRKEEASFADCRLNALTLRLLESLGVRHAVAPVVYQVIILEPGIGQFP